jgi:pantetheine-phosphate adenylyltransferase
MTAALYPGTFDPITHGHHDLVRRAAGIFERVVVGIAVNPGKQPLLERTERVALARQVLADVPNVEVTSFSGLTVHFAVAQGLRVIVRGLRAVADFDFELQLATMSRHLSTEVDYVFLTPTEQFNFITSTLVREIAGLGGDVSHFVHPSVVVALQRAWERRRGGPGQSI